MMTEAQDRSRGKALAAGTPPPSARCEDGTLTVFLLPGLSGDMQEFGSLHPPAGVPLQLVPIHYRHWSDLQPGQNEFDWLVADCIRQIEDYGPPATIRLAGYSFGALIAWAVARSMAASGHRIGLLGVIDAIACPVIEEGARSTIGRLGRLVRGIRRGETSAQMARSFAGVLFRSPAWTRATFRRIHGFGLLPRIFKCIDANLQMRYHIIPLKQCVICMNAAEDQTGCPAVLFRCSERPLGEDADLGWTRYLSRLRIVTLSGNHASVLRAQNMEQILIQLAATVSESEGFYPLRQVTCT